MYVKHCKLRRSEPLRLMEYFVAGTPARTAADLGGVHCNSAIRFFHKWREKIALETAKSDRAILSWMRVILGGRKGKRGRGAAGKTPVFGVLKRGGKVYTQVIDDTKSSTLMPMICQKIKPDSIVYTDCYRSYNTLDVSEFKHFRLNHSELFANKHNHINGIENFWNQAKRHLRKYNGVPKNNFNLFLKECEWWFNSASPKKTP